MLERRTVIRIPHSCRAQYCTAEDLLPRDGRLMNLSERGAGLLAREAHHSGEQVTLTFSVPGADEPLTATGVVRWSHQLRGGGWYPLGLEWFPLEETTRNRLQSFLTAAGQSSARTAKPSQKTSQRITWAVVLIAQLLAAALIGTFIYRWVRSLQQENRRLQAELEQRDGVITQLEQEERRLQGELEAANQRFSQTAEEVARLHQQATVLERDVQRLGQEVGQFQDSYAQLREEREELMQRALDLELERTYLARRLSSLSELKVAIREAIEARNHAQRTQWYARAQALREADRQALANGNRGYLIRNGRPTTSSATMQIRVHEPEALSPAPSTQ